VLFKLYIDLGISFSMLLLITKYCTARKIVLLTESVKVTFDELTV